MPINLSSLLQCSIKWEESFVSFEYGQGQREKNALLYGVLRYILTNVSNAIVPNTGPHAVFGRYMSLALVLSVQINVLTCHSLEAPSALVSSSMAVMAYFLYSSIHWKRIHHYQL